MLVATGIRYGGKLDNVEIVDLSNLVDGTPSKDCNDLPHFPRTMDDGFGALLGFETPVICGGVPFSTSCYAYSNASGSNRWEPTDTIVVPKQAAAATALPNLHNMGNDIMVTG